MRRDRNDVLRSITLLLGEVNRVSKQTTPVPSSHLSSQYESTGEFFSKQQISSITDSLLRSATLVGQSHDRKTLEAMVERTMTTAIRGWLDKSLRNIVDDVVEQQLNSLQGQHNRRVG